MILIGLTGKARSGKDTVGAWLKKHCRMHTTYFAEPIKEGCRAMFGLTDAQLFGDQKETVIEKYGCSPRQLMQWAGTEFGRQMVHPDVWLMQTEDKWRALQGAGSCIHGTLCGGLAVTDVRFENEAAMIRRLGGVVIHVDRPDVQQVAGHVSERGIEFVEGDRLIVNDGTLAELYDQVDELSRDGLGLAVT